MFKTKLKKAFSCFKAKQDNSQLDDSDDDLIEFERRSDSEDHEPYIWSKDLAEHYMGDYSYAVVQAHTNLEDRSQIEVCSNGTFVGVYDGHADAQCATFINDNLFNYFTNHMAMRRLMNEDVIKDAIAATEREFGALVQSTYNYDHNPLIAVSGSCCLIGVIWRRKIYVANLGNSRAVIGSLDSRSKKIVAHQLNVEHKTSKAEIREEIMSKHPDGSDILVNVHGSWRIKGLLQVSRTIGDAYLKVPGYIIPPNHFRFRLSGKPIESAALSSEPSIVTRDVEPNDRFLIFASDGLWEHLSNQQAVEIVHKNPRRRIAKRLVYEALRKTVTKYEISNTKLRRTNKGQRRLYHDDITVVVIYLDHERLKKDMTRDLPELSVKGYSQSVTVTPSAFTSLRGLLLVRPIDNKPTEHELAEAEAEAESSNRTSLRGILFERPIDIKPIEEDEAAESSNTASLRGLVLDINPAEEDMAESSNRANVRGLILQRPIDNKPPEDDEAESSNGASLRALFLEEEPIDNNPPLEDEVDGTTLIELILEEPIDNKPAADGAESTNRTRYKGLLLERPFDNEPTEDKAEAEPSSRTSLRGLLLQIPIDNEPTEDKAEAEPSSRTSLRGLLLQIPIHKEPTEDKAESFSRQPEEPIEDPKD
ncbi:putative protein phosphatase 2C 25 [Bienertia sinuspersici]